MKVSFSSPLVAHQAEVSSDLIAWLYFVVYPTIMKTESYVLGEEIATFTASGKISDESAASQRYSAISAHSIAQKKAGMMADLLDMNKAASSLSSEEFSTQYFLNNLHKISLELLLKDKPFKEEDEEPHFVDNYLRNILTTL